MRSLVALIVLIGMVAPAAAGELWPTPDTGWRYALTVPVGPGRQRYGYVDAEPAPTGGWTVTVTCGVESTRDGRVLSRVVGRGTSNRGRAHGFGGNWSWKGGSGGGSFVVTQSLRSPGALDLPGEFTAPECPRRGVGQLSTGD
ncbi:hypothetical protein [Methylorubrum extorquens]|uniref:hypothetical protein n=1 Tax=Methylorubrum extorquens TaxID=408 RepID=UPI001EE5E975|nr:hypothetical protein [Methylorubrum extorquens]MCG5249519.1 hypothetical protein [Methylorubrum extorquens]